MKKGIFILSTLLMIFLISWQEIQEEAIAINIEVPVRVYDGNKFVENLAIGDFEIFEDGMLQNIEAVYFIKKTTVMRIEEKKIFTPKTQRHFFLFFEIEDFTKRLKEGLDNFFKNVLIPGDELTIVSPLKTYKFDSEVLNKLAREEIVDELEGILRKDAMIGSSGYRSAFEDVTKKARTLTALLGDPKERSLYEEEGVTGQKENVDEIFSEYIQLLANLESLRKIDEQKLFNFSNYLQEMEGQKFVILFYQREFIPHVDPRVLDQAMQMYQDMPNFMFQLQTVYGLSSREVSFDVDRVKQAYSDSSISIHFLFFTKPPEHISGVRFVEHSEDVFSAFREMALATGGFIESSSNPEYLFQKASEAAETYYLVYYSPKNYMADGKFRNINVNIKGKNYRISHRAGYYAD